MLRYIRLLSVFPPQMGIGLGEQATVTQDLFNRFKENGVSTQKLLSALHASTDYERIKSMFGKSIAKLTCYLLKRQFVVQAENRISESLLRMQITLLK